MADTRVTQGKVLGTAEYEVDLRLTSAFGFAAVAYPAEFINLTQSITQAYIKPNVTLRVSQQWVMVAVRGRVANRRIRAWTFSLDGHDFYVLRLDDSDTVVYDMTTGQWMRWSSPGYNFWRAWNGMNWQGLTDQTFVDGAQSQVVAGDDTFGLLWTIDPDKGYDDHPTQGDESPQAFTRVVVGGVPMRLRETQQVGAAYLTASVGSPQITGADITLRTSDDYGKTWQDHGTITIDPGDYTQELSWRSIGLIRAPGRIFELSDDGASVRIDSLDVR